MESNQLNQQAQPNQQRYLQHADDEIDLRQMFRAIWAEKLLVIAVTAAVAAISVVVSFKMTEIYRAETLLAPADTEQSGSGLAAQLGGTAALLGVNVSGNSGNDISNAIAILRSRQFIGRFITENDLLVPLFAGTWDKNEQVSVIDEQIYNTTSASWVLEGGGPSGLDAYRAFSKILTVEGPDRESGLVTVAINWHNPVEAAEWVNQLVFALNQEVRTRDIDEANKAIAFLGRQLETTQLVDMQRIFYQLIESQTRTTMLADIREEYVFRVIDPAVPPDMKISPNRAVISTIGTLFGTLIATVLVLLKNIYSRRATR